MGTCYGADGRLHHDAVQPEVEAADHARQRIGDEDIPVRRFHALAVVDHMPDPDSTIRT